MRHMPGRRRCSPSPTASAATPPGMGTKLTAVLSSGGRPALAHIGYLPALAITLRS